MQEAGKEEARIRLVAAGAVGLEDRRDDGWRRAPADAQRETSTLDVQAP